MVATKNGIRRKSHRLEVPEHLIYELIDGKPIYYKGYRAVLTGEKTWSEIMGSSTLQSFIIAHCQRLLFTHLSEEAYTILSSETGLHIDKHNNLAGDILIFDNAVLPITAINQQYADVPPKVVIEVDITADPADTTPSSYMYQKTQKLLNFGVEKVIWITTDTRKVTIARPNEDWHIKDWNKDVELINGIVINIGKYLAQKGSPFA